jgi:tetratricopeptide (TPR) repeat protein
VRRLPFLVAALSAAVAALPACSPPPPRPAPPGLERAEKALAEGRYGAAARELRSLRPADLEGAETRLRAAQAAVKARDFARAALFLEADAKRDLGRAPGAALLRAECLVRSGRLDDAQQALRAIEAAGSRTERWRYAYALLSLARGERDLGARDMEALATAGSKDPDVLIRWAELPLPDGFDEAKRRLDDALLRATDPAPVLAMRGRLLLLGGREARAALADLEEAVRARPWDREARRDRVRARVRVGGLVSVEAAVREAEGIVAEDPDDGETRIAFAEALGEAGRLAGLGGDGALHLPAPAVRYYERAAEQYGEYLQRPVRDPAMAIRALQGLARTEIQRIPLDETGRMRAPGSHYARAMEALQRAQALDPEGRFRGEWDVGLLAETWYLRGRANKRVHEGTTDHTEALRSYQKALEIDPRHLEACWDLGLLCHDFFPDSPAYWQIAADAFRAHLKERERRDLGALDPERMAIVKSAFDRVARGKEKKEDGKE